MVEEEGDEVQELLILRHATSDRGRGGESDFDRPLSARGRRDASRIGRELCTRALRPDLILSSPALRARETTLAVYAGLAPADGELSVRYEPGIYEASRDTLLKVLGKVRPGTRRVLLVGHNPGLDSLLVHFCGHGLPYTADGRLLTTGALAHVVLLGGWTRLPRADGRLIALIRLDA